MACFSLMMEHHICLSHCLIWQKYSWKRYWAGNWILALYKYIFIIIIINPPERVLLVTCKKQAALQYTCKQHSWHVQHRNSYRIGRRPRYQWPFCSTLSSVDSEKSARKKSTSTDNYPMERQDTTSQGNYQQTGETHSTSIAYLYYCNIMYRNQFLLVSFKLISWREDLVTTDSYLVAIIWWQFQMFCGVRKNWRLNGYWSCIQLRKELLVFGYI